MASHGERRAAEMEESAATLRELGLDPLMVESTVKRQREMGSIGKKELVRQNIEIRPRSDFECHQFRVRSSALIRHYMNARSD